MKYREIEYTDKDIANLFVNTCDEVFTHIHENKEQFQIKFYKNKDSILLDFIEYMGVFKFKLKINHLIEDTIREVTSNIKRKRDKVNTDVSLVSINFKSKIIEDSDYFSPVVTSDIDFKYNISYREFSTTELIGKMTFFVKYLSKNKKKKLLKHCLAWGMKKTSSNAKSFYNMLLEQLKFTFNIRSDYFKLYNATNEDIKRILDKNVSNNEILNELKSAFEKNFPHKYNRGNIDTNNVTVLIDTVEHLDMVNKCEIYEKELIQKKKKKIEKLLE